MADYSHPNGQFAFIEHDMMHDLYMGIDYDGRCWVISRYNNTEWELTEDAVTLALRGELATLGCVDRLSRRLRKWKEARNSEPKLKPVRASTPFA